MIKFSNFQIFFSVVIFVSCLGCNTGKKLESNPLHYSKKGITAYIEPVPNSLIRLYLIIENNSKDTVRVADHITQDENSITIQWPDGRQKRWEPHRFIWEGTTLVPGKKFTVHSFNIAENIAREISVDDKASYETGTYLIFWKNERLGFSTSSSYYFDLEKVRDIL